MLVGVTPPGAEALRAADPLVQLAAARAGLWAVPVLSALPALAWLWHAPPSRAALARAARRTLPALAMVGFGLPVLRLAVGPSLPAFVPPEESAAPGLALGVGAGVLEEALFRFGVLAATFLLLRRRLGSEVVAAALAVGLTALAFAASHELGPGAGDFSPRFFATRFVIPGALMSVLFFRPGPSFLVTLHCTAHVGIALLF